MNYAKADEVLKEFSKMDKQDSRAVMAMDQKNYLDAIKKTLASLPLKMQELILINRIMEVPF